MNGDGIDDLLLGAPGFEGKGCLFIVYGESTPDLIAPGDHNLVNLITFNCTMNSRDKIHQIRNFPILVCNWHFFNKNSTCRENFSTLPEKGVEIPHVCKLPTPNPLSY